jgi:hypothetical protein
MKTREEKTVSVTRQSRAHFFDKRLMLIDIAEEQLKINIRKKSGARQSSK